MAKSPGHRKWPEHKVEEERMGETMKVEIEGESIASSGDVVKVAEDNHPDRLYFPRNDINMDFFTPSETTTECPFKGAARYFHVSVGDKVLADAAWTYETPYDEHQGLSGRLAFDDGKYGEIRISEE